MVPIKPKNIGIEKLTCRYDRSAGSLAINGAKMPDIIVPNTPAEDASEFAISYSLGSNQSAVNFVGNIVIIDPPIEKMILPNNATG